MKNFFLTFISLVCIAQLSFSQTKIRNATSQKTFGGMGGVTMTYRIEIKNKTSAQVEIDSVKSIADTTKADFNFLKNENGFYEIVLVTALAKPEKCRTCRDVNPKSINLTKGAIVYYRKGGKQSFFKVKKFRQLPDIFMP